MSPLVRAKMAAADIAARITKANENATTSEKPKQLWKRAPLRRDWIDPPGRTWTHAPRQDRPESTGTSGYYWYYGSKEASSRSSYKQVNPLTLDKEANSRSGNKGANSRPSNKERSPVSASNNAATTSNDTNAVSSSKLPQTLPAKPQPRREPLSGQESEFKEASWIPDDTTEAWTTQNAMNWSQRPKKTSKSSPKGSCPPKTHRSNTRSSADTNTNAPGGTRRSMAPSPDSDRKDG